MHLNPTFIANIRGLYGDSGDAWIKELPSLLDQLGSKWDFRFLHVMPDLTYNFVGLVEMLETGETAILKMGPTSKTIETEVRWLECFEQGVPKIYGYDPEHYAFLME